VINRDFKVILSEFLEANGLRQSAFAKRINVRPSQVSEWLKGKAKPGYDVLRKMASSFEAGADYFLGISEDY
jgi:transcriptional regulator with XRE-family HTH domain